MKCDRCQQENPAGMKFCGECGARLVLLCSACRASNPPSSKFCGECGAPLAEGTRPPSRVPEKPLDAEAGLAGSPKSVTVLFAGLKGSAELFGDSDPKETRKLLDPLLELMAEAVRRYDGTVSQQMSDGLVALFGAPVAHEDHAVRGCYAALTMHDAVERHASELRRSQGLDVQVWVGLNSGEAVVRSVGSGADTRCTAVGPAIQVAARMDQLARPRTTLLTAETLRLVKSYIEVKPLGPVPVKGLAEPIEVYEILRARPAPTRRRARVARRLTPFVGRQVEFDQLGKALERAHGGQGQLVALVGEPGVGKSRLVWEFTRSHRAQGWLVLETGSVSGGEATAYAPVIEFLKTYFQIEPTDDGRKIREKLTGKLFTLERSLESTLPDFLALFDLPVENPQWQALDPPQRRQRILDAVKRILERESRVQPVCLVFEHLQWFDAETQALLGHLAENLSEARVLLLVTYRPEFQDGWGGKSSCIQLKVNPLSRETAEAFLEALLGDDADLLPLKQILIEASGGNPFFLEESVRDLVEAQLLIGERGSYRPAGDLEGVQVPETAHAVLARRLERLPPEARHLIQSASVIGRDFSFELLQAVAETPSDELRRGLERLQAAGFVYETSLFPELEYTFTHALTQEASYRSLPEERRQAFHGRVVDAIERLYPDRVSAQVDRLGRHAMRAEAWERAFRYFQQAGAKAAARSADRSAAAGFEQALVALDHLPESPDTFEHTIEIRIGLRHLLFPLAELGQVVAHLREAEALATARGDQRQLARVLAYLAHYFCVAGEPDQALDFAQRALDIADALRDLSIQIAATFFLSQAAYSRGHYRRAADWLTTRVDVLQGDRVRERFGLPGFLSVFSHTWLALSLAELGQFAQGIGHGEEALRIAESVDHPFSLSVARHGLSGLYLRKGELGRAVPARALDLKQVPDLPYYAPWVVTDPGFAYALAGRVADAIPWLEQALEHATSRRLLSGQSLQLARLGEAYLLAGRIDDAIKLAVRALELSRQHKERGNEAWVLRLLGEIAAHPDRLDEAEADASYRKAFALAKEFEMRPLMGLCHLGLGTLYRRIGRKDQARAELSTAIYLFGSMDMTFWRGRAEAERTNVG
ncbi:MAG: AAA family ATPase [Candidatus Rokubacteria bacterium]|nr:AAA family ATPase [Candidatus Rokubacteria bacterium]